MRKLYARMILPFGSDFKPKGRNMKITMKYFGGPHDGEISFDDGDSEDELSKQQVMAANHYQVSDRGVVGAVFAIGSPSSQGAAIGQCEVIDVEESDDGITIHLEYRPYREQ